MTSPSVSVALIAYNRKEILKKTLQAYACQSARDHILEIVVTDDGSTDGTGESVREYAAQSPVPIRYFYQRNQGPAKARNRTIDEARGDLILFGDDDVIPQPDHVAQHVAWHQKYPDAQVAVLGYVDWAPELHPTPLMRWLNHAGPHAGYGSLVSGGEGSFFNFYTGNVSLKLEFVKSTGRFDEDFRRYGLADTEFGYRLKKNGMRLLYNPHSVGYHYKRITVASERRRIRAVAKAREIIARKEAGIELAKIQWEYKTPPGSSADYRNSAPWGR